ncbi:MAG: CehA/McbA family metallohydrolase [Armatimonadota bacterium]
MRHYPIPCVLCLALLCASITSAATLTGQVVSDTGQGLPARVLAIQPLTRESAAVYTKPDGHFSLEVPDGKLRLIATHGPEWTIAETEAASGEERTLVLRRLVDMPARGYYGADLHLHSTHSDGQQTPAEVAFDCQAEGLQIAALTDHESVDQQPEWLAQANAGFLPLPGMEITTAMGHILGLNLRDKVSNDVTRGAADLERIFAQVHAQGGFAIVAHPNAPSENYQAPQLHDYDALEILNGSLPPYSSVFDFVQGRKAWHSLLSQGLKIAAVGDSDNHDNLNRQARELLRDPAKAAQLDKRLAMMARVVNFEQVLEPWGWKGLHPGFYRTYLQLAEPTPAGVAAGGPGEGGDRPTESDWSCRARPPGAVGRPALAPAR